MVDLSSCYFCARAVDVPLQEYSIAPPSSPDVERSVVLCRPCYRKLDLLLEPSEEPETAGGTGSATSGSPTAGVTGPQNGVIDDDPEPVFDTDDGSDEPAPERSESASTSTAAGDSSSAPAERAEAEAQAASGDRSTGSDERGPREEPTGGQAENPSADEPTDEAADASANPLVTEADSSARAGGQSSDQDPDRTDSDVNEDGNQTDSAPESSSEGITIGGSESGSSADEDNSGTPSDNSLDVSASTYNKVVRLLQNREFPVVREEFEELASNAYQIDRGDCAGALDAAIQKGLLIEENGLLKRP